MADIKDVEAGKKVSEFIKTINDNFKNLNNENKTKQSTIYVLSTNEQSGDKNITVIDGVPRGGKSGDIVIVYE